MSMLRPNPLVRAPARLSRRLARDQRGVAALEFALVAPVLVMILLGTVEIARAIDADRRFGYTTAATTDLIAREQDLTDNDLTGMMAGVQHMMRPYDSTNLSMRIVAVRAPTTVGDQPKVEWSFAHNETKTHNKCDPYTLPADLVSPGGRVIIVESTYQFTPLFVNWARSPIADRIQSGTIQWSDKATLTPRSDCVHNSTQETSSSRCDFSCP